MDASPTSRPEASVSCPAPHLQLRHLLSDRFESVSVPALPPGAIFVTFPSLR